MERLYNGPIRTSFVLTYATWGPEGTPIQEKKHISLDRGSNLTKFSVHLEGVDTILAGLTLHEKDGEVFQNKTAGYYGYWEPHGDSELGSGIVTDAKTLLGVDSYITDSEDESNVYGELEVTNGMATYYAGFGWKESGQFTTKEAWEAYLSQFARQIQNPLLVTINQLEK